MKEFQVGNIFKCLDVDTWHPDHFVILQVKGDSYSILWLEEPQLTGAINFSDISEKNGKIIIFKTNEIQLLSEHESLVLKLKYAQNW